MNIYRATMLKTPVPLLLTFFLVACGGGGYGGGKNTPNIPPAPSENSSIQANSSVANSTASSTSSVPASGTITQKITTIGGTFVGNGTVNVLLNVGNVLSTQAVDKTGMTLYVFDDDSVGSSTCTTPACVTAWPPLLANTGAIATAPLTIITRTDGNKQWALRDKPLYFFSGDTQAGTVNGEGASNNTWHVAQFQPVLHSKIVPNANNINDGTYLTAYGNVLFAKLNADNTSFDIEKAARDNFSLYTFDGDTTVGAPAQCFSTCAVNWPPLLADDNDIAEAPYSIVSRTMGTAPPTRQWAYQGKPLYFFKNDLVAGDTNGKAINLWHLARPLPVQTKSNAALGTLVAAAGLTQIAVPNLTTNVEQVSIAPKHGFTLYTFDNDTAGVSNCTEERCLTNWPALIADAGAVAVPPYSLVTRASGKLQWALNGMPLYFFAGDTNPGDANGDQVGKVWHAARVVPVALRTIPNNGVAFTAHGNIVNAAGAVDNSRLNFTLYTFDSDTPGVSTCNAGCIDQWPALFAPANATAFGDFTVITRDGTGEKQWAYKGKALYFFIGDTAADQTGGNYPSWQIARP